MKNTKNLKSKMMPPEKDILPAGTPKSEANPYGEVIDPPVPNRAHTEMKLSRQNPQSKKN